MGAPDWFEANRSHLHTVAYRMLGTPGEAEDAVQEAWLRVCRAEPATLEGVRNPAGWLTTVVGRVCLDMLRARSARPEDPVGARPPELPDGEADPERLAVLADSVGPALQVVLDSLGPAERVAFVLHDLFAVSFEEIAPLVGRSPVAAQQLASRARRRVRGSPAGPSADRARQRAVVEAFLAAARSGDFAGLLALLDPDVVLRLDAKVVLRGAAKVAEQASAFARNATGARLGVVHGRPGVVAGPNRALAFTVTDGLITEVDVLSTAGS